MGIDKARIVRTRLGPINGSGPPYEFGSGYLVAPERVLTAAHVLKYPDDRALLKAGDCCQVLTWGSTDWLDADVVWLDADVDIAVLRIPDFGLGIEPVRWGEPVGSEPLPWSAAGYPIASVSDQGRELEHLWGMTSALSQAGAGLLAMTIASRGARRTAADRSGWAGLSGAGVFCGDCVVGVVIRDSGTYRDSVLARRISHVADEKAFLCALPTPVDLETVSGEQVSAFAPSPPTVSRQEPLPQSLGLAAIDSHLPPEPAAVLRTGIVDSLEHIVLSQYGKSGTPPPVSLTGMAGIGKTTAASMLCRRDSLRQSFHGGVVFVRGGPGATAASLANMIRRRFGDRPLTDETDEDAPERLADVLGSVPRLIVLDDLWRPEQILPILSAVQATATQLIFTTRRDDLLTDTKIIKEAVPLPAAGAALAYLAARLGVDVPSFPPSAAAVVERCGRLPLALAICAARIERGTSWTELLAGLTDAEPDLLGIPLATYDHPGVFAAMAVSTAALKSEDLELYERYRQLAVFSTSIPTPEAVVLRLWGASTTAEQRRARRQLTDLAARSLLTYGTLHQEVVLHQLQRDFLTSTGTDTVGLVSVLLNTFGASPNDWLAAAEHEPWLRSQLAFLLQVSSRLPDLDFLLRTENAEGRNCWAELRARHGELDGYLTDLEVWQLPVAEERPSSAIGRQVTAAVVRSSLLSRSTNTPGQLARAAVDFDLWSSEYCLAVLRRVPNLEQRVRAMLTVLDVLDPQQRGECLRLCLAQVGSIREDLAAEVMNAVVAKGNTAPSGPSLDECLDELERVSAGRLWPEHFIGLAEAINPQQRMRAKEIARTASPDRVAWCLAALTRGLDPKEAEEQARYLAAGEEFATRAVVVANAVRADTPLLQQMADSLLEEGVLSGSDVDVASALQVLLPVASDSAVSKLLGSVQGSDLPDMLIESPFNTYKWLGELIRAGQAVPAIVKWARSFWPESFGAGLLAAAADRFDTPERRAILHEVAERLETRLTEPDSTWIADVAPMLEPIIAMLSEQLVIRLVMRATEETGNSRRPAALAPLTRGLTATQRKAVLDRELQRLAPCPRSSDVREALDHLANVLDRQQVALALEIGAAARDDGYERAHLKTLIDFTNAPTRAAAYRWLIEVTRRHLVDPDPTYAHPHLAARLIEELCDSIDADLDQMNEAEDNVWLEDAKDLARSLAQPELRARATAALAQHVHGGEAERLWSLVDDDLALVTDDVRVVENVPNLISRTSGARRRKLIDAVCASLNRVESVYARAQTLRALHEDIDVVPLADELAGKLILPKQDRVLDDLVPLLSENALKRLTRRDLSQGVGAVAKRLAAEGKTSEALALAAPDDPLGWVAKAAAPYLSLDQVRDLLSEHQWWATSWDVDVALLAQLAKLGFAAEATGGAMKLPVGAARLSGIIAIGETLDPAKAASFLLQYIEDFTLIDDVDRLWNCAQHAAPILAQLPPSDLMAVWQQFVGLISGRIRLQALPLLYLTSPIIVALGGSDAAGETFQAVVNVLRWFPSYPKVLQTSP